MMTELLGKRAVVVAAARRGFAPLLMLGCMTLTCLAACTTTHTVRTVGKGNWGIEGSLGGPMFTNLGAPIMAPNLFVGGRYGLLDDLDLSASYNLTSPIIPGVALDLILGAQWAPIQPGLRGQADTPRQGWALSTRVELHSLTDFKTGFLAVPALEVAGGYRYRWFNPFVGCALAFNFYRPGNDPNVAVLSPFIGMEFIVRRHLGLSLRVTFHDVAHNYWGSQVDWVYLRQSATKHFAPVGLSLGVSWTLWEGAMTRRLPWWLRLLGCWFPLAAGAGCIELDFFLFEPEGARSVADDYHGLPLYQGPDEPPWLAAAVTTVEREVYVAVPSAEVLPPDGLAGHHYLHGAFLPAPQDCPVEDCPLIEQPPTILYQHGNSGNLWRYWPQAVVLWTMGANVFIYTYRGYGLSSGEPSKAGILTDADTAMAYLMSRSDVDSRRVVAYGYSMGGLPTSYLVGRSSWRGQFAAVVLESALDGPESTVNLSTGTEFPRGFFLDEDTLFFGPGYMKGASLPILHLHGQQDGRVVLAQAENYYAVLKGRPEYTHYIGRSNRPGEEWIARCGHRNITSWAFDSDMAIAHFWDSSDNPGHCCLHPLEWLHDENADFIQRAGGTTGAAAYAAAMDYQQLVTQWLQSVLP